MDQQVTLENIGKLMDTKLDAKIGPIHQRIDELTEIMLEKFDDVEERLERIETKVDTNHENRIARLEDSNRVIKTKLGLS
jgi:hypothetical protein